MLYELHKAIDLKVEKPFILIITYNNGNRRKYDIEPFLDTEVFGEMKDNFAYFSQVKLSDSGMYVYWPHEQDLCVNSIYEAGIPLEE